MAALDFKIKQDTNNVARPPAVAAFLLDTGTGYINTTIEQLGVLLNEVLEGRVTNNEQAIAILQQNQSNHVHDLASATAAGFMSAAHFVKLSAIVDYFKGYHTDATALSTAHPSGQAGFHAYVGTTTKTIYIWDTTLATPAWRDTGLTSSGDMLVSIYDPRGIAKDVYDRVNHTGTQGMATITGLADALLAKRNTGEAIPMNEIDGLSLALAGKASANHTQEMSTIIGLLDALNQKSPVGHGHANATQQSAGFMSPEDKIKLDNIAGGGTGGGGGVAATYGSIAARDLDIPNRKAGEIVKVLDASGDTTVDAGYAYYEFESGGTWRKLSEQESMDVTADFSTVEIFADIHSDFVASGLVYSTSPNLTASYTAGIVYVGGKRRSIAAGSSTVAASSDTYADVSSAGAIVLTAVLSGAAAPALAAGSVRIAKLVSDTVAVTAVTDLRSGDYNINTINGGRFKVNGAELAADAATTTYTPADTTKWEAVPTHVKSALDELVTRTPKSNINWGNIAFVSKNGDNATAAIGQINRPYQTIQAAMNAMVLGGNNGVVIWVLPGVYAEALIVDGYQMTIFLDGATISGSIDVRSGSSSTGGGNASGTIICSNYTGTFTGFITGGSPGAQVIKIFDLKQVNTPSDGYFLRGTNNTFIIDGVRVLKTAYVNGLCAGIRALKISNAEAVINSAASGVLFTGGSIWLNDILKLEAKLSIVVNSNGPRIAKATNCYFKTEGPTLQVTAVFNGGYYPHKLINCTLESTANYTLTINHASVAGYVELYECKLISGHGTNTSNINWSSTDADAGLVAVNCLHNKTNLVDVVQVPANHFANNNAHYAKLNSSGFYSGDFEL